MKKLFKALSAVLAAAAIFTITSCSGGKKYSKFEAKDFNGDWTVGKWTVTGKTNLTGSDTDQDFSVEIKTGALDEQVTMTKIGEESTTAPLSEFVEYVLTQTEKLLPSDTDLEEMKKEGFKISGIPYLEINEGKTDIRGNFSVVQPDGNKLYLTINVTKKTE